jgi:hypothetical protein
MIIADKKKHNSDELRSCKKNNNTVQAIFGEIPGFSILSQGLSAINFHW